MNRLLLQIRRSLQLGAEHLSEQQIARLNANLEAGDPNHEVPLASQCYEQVRAIYHAAAKRGRELAAKALAAFPSCPIPGIARPGRTLKSWRQAILAYFKTQSASNGPTEAVNGVIETTRRIARGFRNCSNYRLCNLLSAGDHRPYRIKPTNHA